MMKTITGLLLSLLFIQTVSAQTLVVPNATVGGSGNANVGIGISNPTSKLHLYKSSSAEMNLETDADNAVRLYMTGANQQWSIRKLNNNEFALVDDTNNGVIPFRIQPGASINTFRIESHGNVVIGTSDANSKLH